MKTSHRPKQLALILSLALVLCASVLAYLSSYWTSAPPSAEQVVQNAWRLARESGAYHFKSEIVQTTYPAPALSNVGRSSRKETMYVDGQMNLPERSLLMRLYNQGANPTKADEGLELRVERGRAYGRIGGEEDWKELDNASSVFAPGRDVLAYLVGARNIRMKDEGGTPSDAGRTGMKDERVVDSSFIPSTSSGQALHPSSFVFDVDGPAFARYMREQLEQELREKGKLPAGLSLDFSDSYRGLSGEGELWIDGDGLPLRLIVHVVFPEQRSGERVEADIKTDFAQFDRTRIAQANCELRIATGTVPLGNCDLQA